MPDQPQADLSGGVQGVLWRNVTNISAVTFLMVCFGWFLHDQMQAAKADRAMFREELRALRDTHQSTLVSLDRSIRELQAEMRSMMTELRRSRTFMGPPAPSPSTPETP